MPLALADLQPLLGIALPDVEAHLSRVVAGSMEKDVKTYPDATYHNYYALGLSLCFLPSSSPSSSSSVSSALILDSIDIFNPPPTPPKKAPKYAAPPSPLVFRFAETEVVLPARKAGEKEIRYPRGEVLEVGPGTTGREIVRALGEPSRKGAGGWIGVWLEWSPVTLLRGEERVDVGVMLELNDPKVEKMTEEQKAKGIGGVWDRAAGWQWGSIKVFRPTKKA